MARSFLHDDSGVSVIIGAMLLILITVIAAAGLALIVSQSEKQAADRQALQDSVNNEKLRIASISFVNGSSPNDKKIVSLTMDIMNMNKEQSKLMAISINGKYLNNYTSEAGTPAFHSDVQGGVAPLTVSFVDDSTDSPSGWQWDFGDGSTSTEQNPVHKYTNPGPYTVTLIITNHAGNDQQTKIDYINVTNPVEFHSDVQNGVVPLKVNFSDDSVSASNWQWDFGDGSTSTAQNPMYTYHNPGIYYVSLTATVGSTQYTQTKEYYINASCVNASDVVNFHSDVQSGGAPLTVKFYDDSNHSSGWDWNFGDGSSHDSTQNPTHQYTDIGQYNVTLKIKNGTGADSQYTRTLYINVVGIPLANFNKYNEPRNGMVPLKVDFVDTSINNPTSWLWDFGDGSTSTAQNPTHVYAKPGTYSITLKASNLAGSSTSNPQITTVVVPEQETMPLTIAGGGHSDITIYTNDLSVMNDKPLDIELVTSYVNYFSRVFNPPQAMMKVNVDTEQLTSYRDYLLLDGSGSTSENGTIISWQWHITDYANKMSPIAAYGRVTRIDPPQIQSNDQYIISLTVTDNNGLTSTSDPVTIPYDPNFSPSPSPTPTPTATPTPAPVADFTADVTNGSPGVKVTFTDYSSNTPTAWDWNFGDNTAHGTAQNPTHIYSTAGTYTVSLTAINAGGSNTRTKYSYITVS